MSEILTPQNAPAVFRSYGGIKPTNVSDVLSGVKIGIYGPGGIGKTTLAASACDTDLGWPAAYLDSRGNPEVIKSYGDKIQVFPITKFEQLRSFRNDLIMDKNCPFKTIILDNVSDMWSINLRDRYGSSEVTWQMHSGSTADVLGVYRDYCDLATIAHLRMNVIFVMWETPEARKIKGQDVERSEMMFNKALQMQVGGILTWVGRLYITPVGTGKWRYLRCLDFRPIEDLHQAKYQVDPNDEFTSQIPMEIYDPSLASIIDTAKGGIQWPKEKHTKPVLAVAPATK